MFQSRISELKIADNSVEDTQRLCVKLALASHVGGTSVSGEAGWAGETRTVTPKNSQNVPYYHLKEARAACG